MTNKKDYISIAGVDLLRLIGNDSENRDTAFREFYQRYKDYVWKLSFNISKGYPNPRDIAELLFEDCFLAISKKASNYIQNEELDIDTGIKIWISGIVKILFMKQRALYFSKPRVVDLDIDYIDSTLGEVQSVENDGDLENSRNTNLLYEAIEQLSCKQRDILMILFSFNSVRNIPLDIRDHLCAEYGLKSSSLRKVKLRAIHRIKAIISDSLNTSPESLKELEISS